MTERVKPTVFLERRSYRRRRLLDGLRILPFLGAWLFSLPLLWSAHPPDGADQVTLSSVLVFVFLVWGVLSVICFGLVIWIRTLSAEFDSSKGI